MNLRLLVPGTLLCCLLLPLPVSAQGSFTASLGLDVSAISVKSESPTIDENLSGVVAGGSVALTWSRLSVDLLYLQGSADPEGVMPGATSPAWEPSGGCFGSCGWRLRRDWGHRYCWPTSKAGMECHPSWMLLSRSIGPRVSRGG
jgi:hypothetical protein